MLMVRTEVDVLRVNDRAGTFCFPSLVVIEDNECLLAMIETRLSEVDCHPIGKVAAPDLG